MFKVAELQWNENLQAGAYKIHYHDGRRGASLFHGDTLIAVNPYDNAVEALKAHAQWHREADVLAAVSLKEDLTVEEVLQIVRTPSIDAFIRLTIEEGLKAVIREVSKC